MIKLAIALTVTVFALTGMALNAADAKATYDKECAKCHGKEGKGDTKMGQKLKVKDYTDAKVQAEITDEKAIKAIKEGVKDGSKTVMKAYELSDAEVKDLVALIRTFKK